MPVKLTRYNTSFATHCDGLKVGVGCQLTIQSLSLVPAIKQRPESACADYDVVAVVELRMCVAIERQPVQHCRCQGCDAAPPLPDQDACWYLIENGDNGRIAFAGAEDMRDERDAYPVTGWRTIDKELYCADCATALDAAKAALKTKRGKTK